ncbi:transport protein [Ceratobasidium sp. AG-Ba]|nr:transport protein [Ceratobasidium sp. AG-Ba]
MSFDNSSDKSVNAEVTAHEDSDDAVYTRDRDEREQGETSKLNHEERLMAERRLVRKLDLRLLPTVIVIFILNYIDRNAITTARLRGLEKDLNLSDVEYQTTLAILYVSYSLLQVPSNMIINKVSRPSYYIGTCVILWGLISALTGTTHNFASMVACRFFLGAPEAAFYPGSIYLLSRWYTRKELGLRSALLYFGLLVSNAFGSLLAAGILGGMQGKRGIAAWRWLFFIEGSITVFVGILSMWLLPDFPHNTRWLSETERQLAQARLAEDAAEADEDGAGDSAFAGLRMALKDPKVLLFALMSCSQVIGLSFVSFFPTLTSTLGYSTVVSLLLAAPPWVFSAIVCLVGAWHADRTGERFFHIAGWWWFVIVGYIIALSTMETAARYVSMFMMAAGFAGFALTLVWVSNAVPRPPAKRAAAIGVVNGCGNIGSLIGSFVWKAAWSPKYHQSMIIGIVTLVLSSAVAFVIRTILIRDNRRLDQEELDELHRVGDAGRVREAARLEGITMEEAIRRRRGFRYLY